MMKLDDLQLGDILFYYNKKSSTVVGYSVHYSVTHVAIVSLTGTSSPWVSHVNERGLIFYAIKMREHGYNGLKYLAYRLKYGADHHFAQEAGVLARMWCTANPRSILIKKPARQRLIGTGASGKPDGGGIYGDRPAVSVPGRFSYFKSHIAALRSCVFGRSALGYVKRLQRYKLARAIPPELTSYWGSMYCSMFVESCYQSAFGAASSADMLAVDAQTVLPWTLHEYLDSRVIWQCMGEVDFYYPLNVG